MSYLYPPEGTGFGLIYDVFTQDVDFLLSNSFLWVFFSVIIAVAYGSTRGLQFLVCMAILIMYSGAIYCSLSLSTYLLES